MIEGWQEQQVTNPQVEPLQRVVLFLTRACNLRCRHCYLSAGIRREGELATQEWLALVDDLARMGVRHIGFSGGEPLLRTGLFEIAERAQQSGIGTTLVTNGTLLGKADSERIEAFFDGVQVSLDGLRPENDLLRGDGSFARAVRGIESLRGRNVDVTVSCTVSSLNKDKLDPFLAFLVELGVREMCGVLLTELGRCEELGSVRMAKKDFVRCLSELSTRWANKISVRHNMSLMPPPGSLRMNCSAGNGVLEIDATGEVYPRCNRMRKNLTPVGSLRDSDISTIYYRSPQLNAIRKISVLDELVCRECDFRHLCGGRCLPEDGVFQAQTCEMAEIYTYIFGAQSWGPCGDRLLH